MAPVDGVPSVHVTCTAKAQLSAPAESSLADVRAGPVGAPVTRKLGLPSLSSSAWCALVWQRSTVLGSM